jgi:hypothetical protein
MSHTLGVFTRLKVKSRSTRSGGPPRLHLGAHLLLLSILQPCHERPQRGALLRKITVGPWADAAHSGSWDWDNWKSACGFSRFMRASQHASMCPPLASRPVRCLSPPRREMPRPGTTDYTRQHRTAQVVSELPMGVLPQYLPQDREAEQIDPHRGQQDWNLGWQGTPLPLLPHRPDGRKIPTF